MINFFCRLFNIIRVGDRFMTNTELLNDTVLVATVTAVKKNTVVYNVSINGTEHTNVPRVNSLKRFKKIYKERL